MTLTFPSTLRTFLLFITVAMLSLYQSAVNCKGTKGDGKPAVLNRLFLVLLRCRNTSSVYATVKRAHSSFYINCDLVIVYPNTQAIRLRY
jgi:hypothetical protein